MTWIIPWCPPPYIPMDTDAWHLFGYGIGQAQIIGFGLIAGILGVLGYRLYTRGKRYGRGGPRQQRTALA